MGITLDANRVIFPTQRRFNAAWQEMSGGKVRLLPQVASELTHHRLDLDHLEDQAHRARAALRRAENTATRRELLLRRSDLWWAEELLRDDGVYGLVSMTRHQHERANAICDAIDARAFPNVRRDEVPTHSDAIIIAQALATGQSMLITGNMRSIDHAAINDWASQNAGKFDLQQPDVLHVQDEVMPRLFASPQQRLELCAIGLAASWPEDVDATWEQVDAAFQRMLSVMPDALLDDTAAAIANAWMTVPEPEALLEATKSRLPHKMRASERRHPAMPRKIDAG